MTAASFSGELGTVRWDAEFIRHQRAELVDLQGWTATVEDRVTVRTHRSKIGNWVHDIGGAYLR